MPEYIDREAVLNDIAELFTLCHETFPNESGHHFIVEEELETHWDFVNKLPAADVREVVLCKDCKHSDTFAPDCTEATFPLKCLSIRYGGVYPDWFCEHGEKREES